jgi:ATP-dependent protease ClpP protease subunit
MIIDWKEYRQMALSLLEMGYIPIYSDFGDELREVVVECINKSMKEAKAEVTLLIDSAGGNDACFNSIKGAMTISSMRFHGLVTGCAASNAFRLLQHCDTRKAIRNASLVFHWGSLRIFNTSIAALMEGETWPIDDFIAYRRATLHEVHERTGMPEDELMRYARQERVVYAENALTMNWIDEVLEDVPSRIKKANGLKNTK